MVTTAKYDYCCVTSCYDDFRAADHHHDDGDGKEEREREKRDCRDAFSGRLMRGGVCSSFIPQSSLTKCLATCYVCVSALFSILLNSHSEISCGERDVIHDTQISYQNAGFTCRIWPENQGHELDKYHNVSCVLHLLLFLSSSSCS